MDKNIIIVNGRFKVVNSDGVSIYFDEPVLSAEFQEYSHHCGFIRLDDEDGDGYGSKYTLSFDSGIEYSDLDRINFRLRVFIPELGGGDDHDTYYVLRAAGIDLYPQDFMKGIINQDLIFSIPTDLVGGDKGCVLPLGVDSKGESAFEPCAKFQPLEEDICIEEIFEVTEPEDPSPDISLNYNGIDDGIEIIITPKDTTLDCDDLSEFDCNINKSCVWNGKSCDGKLYILDTINMDLDWIILDEEQDTIDGVELRESRVIVDNPVDETLTINLYHKDIVKKHSCLTNIEIDYIDPLDASIKNYSVKITDSMCFTLTTGPRIIEDDTVGEWWAENDRELIFIKEFHPGENYAAFSVMGEDASLYETIFPGNHTTLIPTDCHLWNCVSEEYCFEEGLPGEDICNAIDGCHWDTGECVIEYLVEETATMSHEYIKGQKIFISGDQPIWIPLGGAAMWRPDLDGWVGTFDNLWDWTKGDGSSQLGARMYLPDWDDLYRFKLTGKQDTRPWTNVNREHITEYPSKNERSHYPKNLQKAEYSQNSGEGWQSPALRIPCKDYFYRKLNTLESFFEEGPPENVHPNDWRIGLESIHIEGGIINAVDYSGDGISDGWLGTLVELDPSMTHFMRNTIDGHHVFWDASYDNCFICSGGDTGHEYDSGLDVIAIDNMTNLESDELFDDATHCCHDPHQVTTYYEQRPDSDDNYGRTWLSTQKICTGNGDGPVEWGGVQYYKHGSECLEDETEDSLGNCIGPDESGAIVDRFGIICLEGSMDLCGICYGDSSYCVKELNVCAEVLPEEARVDIEILKIDTLEAPPLKPPLDPMETHELIVSFVNNVIITEFSFDISSINPVFSDGQPVVSFVEDIKDTFYLYMNQYHNGESYVTNIGGITWDPFGDQYGLGTPAVRHQIKIRFDEFRYWNELKITNADVRSGNTTIGTHVPEGTGFNGYDIPSSSIYGCLDEGALNFNPIAVGDCDVLGKIDGMSYNCCKYYFDTWPFDSYTSDPDTTETDPFTIGSIDYVLFEWVDGHEYEESDISNVEFFDNLVNSYRGGTEFTVGTDETLYALYGYQSTCDDGELCVDNDPNNCKDKTETCTSFEYEPVDVDYLVWLSGFLASSGYGGYSDLDDWLMTSNDNAPVDNITTLLDGVFEEFGGVQIDYPDIYIRQVPQGGTDRQVISYPFSSEFGEADFRDVLEASYLDESGTDTQDPSFLDNIQLYFDNDFDTMEVINLQYFGTWNVQYDTTGEFVSSGYRVPPGAALWMEFYGSNGIIRWTLPE